MKTQVIKNNYKVSFESNSKLNILNSKDVENELIDIVKIENSLLTVDLSNIKFIDSSGFETLLNLYKISIINDSNIQLIKTSKELIELFELVELNNIFELN